jgi:hypothetical protein
MTLRERIAAREANDPCFCEGPWRDIEPGDRPETALGREHELGGRGCERNYGRSPRREPEWMRRRREVGLPAKDLTLA